jgi:hypothetical protein
VRERRRERERPRERERRRERVHASTAPRREREATWIEKQATRIEDRERAHMPSLIHIERKPTCSLMREREATCSMQERERARARGDMLEARECLHTSSCLDATTALGCMLPTTVDTPRAC